jgi:hypothetical protein
MLRKLLPKPSLTALCGAALLLAPPFAQNHSPASRTQTPASGALAPIPDNRAVNSYAVYSLLVPGGPSHTILPTQVRRWTVADATVNITDMDPAIPPDAQLKAPPDNPKAFSEALQDFETRKDQRFRLEPAQFPNGQAPSLIGEQQVSSLRQSRATDTGITFFTAVYFNSTQTAALVYVNDWCSSLCAAGQWVYLEKHGGQWQRRSGLVSGGA